MKQRRRLGITSAPPITAAVLAMTLIAGTAIGVGTTSILKTESDGIEPITATTSTENFNLGQNVLVNDAALATQSDEEGPVERTVKQFNREEEFSIFAMTWAGEKDIAAFVRSQRADGTWTEWFESEAVDAREVADYERQGTEPIYVEPTKSVQVSILGVDLFNPEEAAKLDAVFIDGGESPIVDTQITLANDAVGLPRVISRKGWGADESIRCKSPEYADGVSAVVVHHTAGSNNYTEAQAPGIVRGIYQYHAQQLGWCDIGYHALADKYGNLYEGRYGGLNKAVIGTHAGGFNQNTWAISMLGNYQTAQPTAAMLKSVGELAGWRAKVAGFNPSGNNTHYSEGTSYTQYPYGTAVQLPNIFAHRDVGLTECPGDYVYNKMGTIRQIAQAKYDLLTSNAVRPNPQPKNTIPPVVPQTPNRPIQPSQPSATGSSSEGADLFTKLLSSNNGDATTIIVSAASLIVLGIGVAGALGVLPEGGIERIGNIEVVKGLKLEKIPALISASTQLSSDSELSRLWNQLSPILGKLRSGTITYSGADGRDVTYQLFDNGIIVDSETTGPQALWGVIGDTWAAQGFDFGPLGLPINMEHPDNGKIRVDFEHGYITFDPATGAVDAQAYEPAPVAP
ncbi:N-acetylmuramoyl-L-alanine amidase [Corynebacterium sp. ES2775-CONJ]|uniref:N-acetylmuramoyl-L-alanine amidase n=1 Tax=Corynebacterium sp. ES2775-CONJ TaxID=2974029 RepID=UPI002167C259|nr:N-acetylmuramoyl-L-alanine amidase [Corynebacterium sp. ES2775-CONJ]MCS4490126.1 N-acetylmuramoyl-L-alanine amidase [Corynebacterium sp. ES2775-CONJ]